MQSDTPRTDSNAGYYCGHGIHKNPDLYIDPKGPFVSASFARELERELDEQCRLNGKGSEREAALLGKVERLERENAKLRDDCLLLAQAMGIEEHYRHLLPDNPGTSDAE